MALNINNVLTRICVIIFYPMYLQALPQVATTFSTQEEGRGRNMTSAIVASAAAAAAAKAIFLI